MVKAGTWICITEMPGLFALQGPPSGLRQAPDSRELIDCCVWGPCQQIWPEDSHCEILGTSLTEQLLLSVVTPMSRAPWLSSSKPNLARLTSRGTSRATTLMPNVDSMSTNLAITPTVAPRPVLTVGYSSCTSVSKLISAVNPFSHAHAGPNDAKRHVGDLGNIKTNAQGNAIGNVEDKWIKLIGEQSVLGVCFPPAEKRWRDTDWINSVPSSFMLAPTTLARVATKSHWRLAMLVAVLLAVCVRLLCKIVMWLLTWIRCYWHCCLKSSY